MKNLYIFLCLLMTSSGLKAQIVNIPDVNFKNALIEAGVDTNGDGEIQISEAEAVINLNVNGKDISSLEGIESFVNIEELKCSSNNLVTLDMSQNPNLQRLDCGRNQLTALDVYQNTNLKILACYTNQLNNLDVSQNINLEILDCPRNHLNILDLSRNSKLQELNCDDSQLTRLNIANGNNPIMHTMISWGNPDLLCIQVDDENASRPECDGLPTEGWCKDEWTWYSEDCQLGVDDIKNLGFKLYPNPVKDIMILESDAEIINPAIKIFSLEGRLLTTQNLEFEKQASMDVSTLSKGIYFLQITSEGKQITYKFLKE